MDCPIPVLIENTAGGDNAMSPPPRHHRAPGDAGDRQAREPDEDRVLPRHLPRPRRRENLEGIVDRVKAITGRIDLVHRNDSARRVRLGRRPPANLGHGQIDPELILEICQPGRALIVAETPAIGQAEDIALLEEPVLGRFERATADLSGRPVSVPQPVEQSRGFP